MNLTTKLFDDIRLCGLQNFLASHFVLEHSGLLSHHILLCAVVSNAIYDKVARVPLAETGLGDLVTLFVVTPKKHEVLTIDKGIHVVCSL